MVVGCLGSIVFQVSESTVRTLDNLAWSGSARYATHERHLMGALTEFPGMDPERVTFDITLCAELGVDPLTEAKKIATLEDRGQVVPLTIGTRSYGKYRWTILKHEMKAKAYSRNGNVHTATVSVSLQEYLRR